MMPSSVLRALSDADVDAMQSELSFISEPATVEQIAVMMAYVADGLSLPVPAEQTIEVYMHELNIPASCLRAVTSGILQRHKWKRYPTIADLTEVLSSTPEYNRIRSLKNLLNKLDNKKKARSPSEAERKSIGKKLKELIDTLGSF
tara:strand:+ start:6426 stop:6863 length:438 start_codon:yes stop_codon:yes gene_type:complete